MVLAVTRMEHAVPVHQDVSTIAETRGYSEEKTRAFCSMATNEHAKMANVMCLWSGTGYGIPASMTRSDMDRSGKKTSTLAYEA